MTLSSHDFSPKQNSFLRGKLSIQQYLEQHGKFCMNLSHIKYLKEIFKRVVF